MSTTVSYKGNTIATLNNETKTLTTGGTWLEDNITITDTSSGGSGTGAISVVDTTDSHGGTVRTITALDISDTTAVASDVAQGKYFYTAQGVKTAGTSSGGGSSGQTSTGTVTGTGTTTLEIPCSFEPDLVYIQADLSDDVSLRGVVSLTILKDIALYMTSDGSQSAIQENLYRAVHGISSYNENNQNGEPYASYSNGVLSINTVENTSTARFASGVTYSYKLVGCTSSGSTPSATQHSIYFEFADSTDTTITAYWDGTFISDAITATIPATYGQKTVTLAQLDGVTWYNPTNIPLNTQLVDYTAVKAGYIIDGTNGEETANESGFASDYIVIDPTMTFTYIGYEWWDAAFYDSSKVFISGFTQREYADSIDMYAYGTLTPARIPANAMYIRLTSYPNGGASSTTMSLIRTA